MRALIIGGFEPSGHDRVHEALVEGARARGHDIASWRWTDLADHPALHAHRCHALTGAGPFPSDLFGSTFGTAIAADISGELPDLTRFDHVVSCHPYSTLAASAAAAAQGVAVPVSDVHTDFTSGPALWPDGLAYSFSPRHDRARHRTRLVTCGIPLSGFSPSTGTSGDNRLLVVLSGHGGWLANRVIANLPKVVEAIAPAAVIVIGSHEIPSLDVPVVVERHVRDMPGLLRGATWALTKCSGASVAECLDTGTRVIGVPSGVPWEDDALRWLACEGLATTPEALGRTGPDAAWASQAVDSWIGHGQRSVAAIWTELERSQGPIRAEPSWLSDTLRAIVQDPRLPSLRKAALKAARNAGYG